MGGENPLEALSQVTGGLAHEIRNPLSTLRVNLQLLAEDVQELDQTNNHVRRSLIRIAAMQGEVNRLSEILNDFIRFVAHHRLDLQERDVNKVIEQLIEFFEPQATSGSVRIMTQLHGEPLICRLDVDLFKQAVLNLLLNAQQAMPEGGDLMIRTQRVDGKARIDVADTGVGIPPEHLDRIFEAYFSTKKEGTGLGLAMTKRIISEHGGTIRVESEVGKGTHVSITLSLAADAEEAS